MSRLILVLDAFTNGHDAALAFINRQDWKEAECEVVFCGTHAKLLQRLIEGSAFAVVPVKNSIAGQVTEVTGKLVELREMGYDLEVRDELDLQINHCLLASQDVNEPAELEWILSHEKAIAQCGRYLDQIGIAIEQRCKRDSTGNAAKVVSRLGSEVKTGAIASKRAAEEYGLKVLTENIQDVADNKTTFLLLENKAEVKSVVVGIIGIAGRFGQMLKAFFERLGCQVVGSDAGVRFGLDNVQVVNQADVVIFSVPVADTPEIINAVMEYTREDQLLMDVTSTKAPAVESMLCGKAQVLGLHPMFRPDVPFDGQTVVACPARLTLSHWKTWAVNMLTATGAKITWSTPNKHDEYMGTVQVMPHLANLASSLLITEAGISVAESLEFTSPFYRVLFSLMGRLIGQNPKLYTGIIMGNSSSLAILERRIELEQRLVKMIRARDYQGFEQLFVTAREHFGSEVVKEANELFMRIIAVLNTLYGKNSVTLEFSKVDSRPGLLRRILQVFDARQVNLTGINSVFLEGGRLQFTISFEQPRSSNSVRLALEEIEAWQEPRANILN